MTKVGIIGGAGFVGYSIAKYLSSKNIKVSIYDIKEPEELLEDVRFVKLDITKDDLSDIGNNDVIIHTAIIQIPQININVDLGYKVNIIGTQRILEEILRSNSVKGFILTSTWHVYGERLEGEITEEYGYHPSKVAERAQLYCNSKIGQEVLTYYFRRLNPNKEFIILRLGTVLGERMPEKTAANIFIDNALKGKPITPYKDSMYRPMLYVDVNDVVNINYRAINKIMSGVEFQYKEFNVLWPEPITILDLATIIKNSIYEITEGKINPEIKIVDTGKESLFDPISAKKIRGNISRLKTEFGVRKLTDPKEALRRIILTKLKAWKE